MNYLIFDGNYVAHKAYHTTGELRNGVLYGFLRQIMAFQKLEGKKQLQYVFCFDSKESYRRQIASEYKKNRSDARRELPESVRAELNDMYRQIDDVAGLLRDLGMCVLKQPGYEGDDLIAKCCEREGNKILVASDEDLFQLLCGTSVVMCRDAASLAKGMIYAELDLMLEYDCSASMWAEVKAIAGCKGDNVKGVPGVGNKVALKWLGGQMLRGKKADAIRAAIDSGLIAHNLKLVKLPLDASVVREVSGVEAAEIDMTPLDLCIESGCSGPSAVKNDAWNRMCMDWELPSLRRKL